MWITKRSIIVIIIAQLTDTVNYGPKDSSFITLRTVTGNLQWYYKDSAILISL